jgi:tyrosyl-DNA phosphodiesterase 2
MFNLLQLTKFTTGQLGDIIPDVAWLRPLSLPTGLLSVFLYWKCRRLTETAVDAGVEGRLHPMYCDHKLIVSTCLFPGPSQSGIHSKDRLDKADQYLECIDRCGDPNAVLGGDMNWDDDLDGPFPIEGRKGWVDAWCELRGDNGSAGGLTYDSVANPMLRSFKSGRTRPDRFICKLRDFNLDSIEMIGTEAIPGVTYYDDKGNQLPVLPSHHFGLMLTVSPKQD